MRRSISKVRSKFNTNKFKTVRNKNNKEYFKILNLNNGTSFDVYLNVSLFGNVSLRCTKKGIIITSKFIL